jgi:Integrase
MASIADRRHVSNESKATKLDEDKLPVVADPYTAMSLRLQAAFGPRREQSIKLRPQWADHVDTLHLKASWTKGGRERDVPITTELQRDVLNEAKALARAASRIPAEMSYRDQLNRFKAQTARWHRSRARPSPRLCTGALRDAHRMKGAGSRRPEFEAAQHHPEGGGSRGEGGHLERAGSRARADHNGLSGSLTQYSGKAW